MIFLAQVFVQQLRNTLNKLSVNYCQQQPKNTVCSSASFRERIPRLLPITSELVASERFQALAKFTNGVASDGAQLVPVNTGLAVTRGVLWQR